MLVLCDFFTILEWHVIFIIVVHWSLRSSSRAGWCRGAAELQSLSIADVDLCSLSLSFFLRLLQRNVMSVFVIVDLSALGEITIEVCTLFADIDRRVRDGDMQASVLRGEFACAWYLQ